MTFRTTVKDGLIVINTHGEIPDGTPVEVVPAAKPRAKGRSRRPKSANRTTKPIRDLDFFGIWKNRPEWKGKTTLQIAAELREKALGRQGRPPRG